MIRLFLCGDVMTGRGIDQVLPHPSPPHLMESFVTSARDYVALAERAHGPIPKPVDFPYIWGDALAELDRAKPDLRIVNLETAVTTSEDYEAKGINYRMNPRNIPCITSAAVDCCVLANNHVMDWGRAGLVETLATLVAAGLATAGAGRDLEEASAPAVLPVPGKGRVLVFSFADESSGTPGSWAAGAGRPGVSLLPDLSDRTAALIADGTNAQRRPGDVVVVSIHWGSNWGYRVPRDQRDFAHALIDRGGADIVHGHSSHHPKGVEVHRGKPILYGCGDFLNDYEGIEGYETYRDDLVLMYLPEVDPASGRLASLEMVPLQIRNFRLNSPSPQDAAWLRGVMDRECRAFGAAVEAADGGRFALRWS